MCYFKGTDILVYDPTTQLEIYKPVEFICVGDYLATYPNHYPVRVEYKIRGNTITRTSSWINEKYQLPLHKFLTLSKPLYVTGQHSILVNWQMFERYASPMHPILKYDFDDETDFKEETEEDLYFLMAAHSRLFEYVREDFSDELELYHFILEGNIPFVIYVNGLLLSETTTTDYVDRMNE